jgi:hypothetical protein
MTASAPAFASPFPAYRGLEDATGWKTPPSPSGSRPSAASSGLGS